MIELLNLLILFQKEKCKIKFFGKSANGNLYGVIRYKIPKYSREEINELKKFNRPEDKEVRDYNESVLKEFK